MVERDTPHMTVLYGACAYGRTRHAAYDSIIRRMRIW